MSDYYDVLAFRKTRNDKSYAVKLGTAKKKDDGGFWVDCDAMIAPTDGKFSFIIAPRKEREASGGGYGD